MSDWIFENAGKLFLLLLLFCIAIIALMVLSAGSASSEHDRLVKQCMHDKHPEWWCEAALKDPQQHTIVMPMPVYIPSGR